MIERGPGARPTSYAAAVDLDAGGKEISIKVGVMTVWVKDGGTWKLLAHQSFKPT